MADDQNVYNHRLGQYTVETKEQAGGEHRQVVEVGSTASGLTKDYNLEVKIGNITGVSAVAINGHDSALTTTQTTIFPTASTSNIDQSGLSATPATVKVASDNANDTSAGTGARTLTIIGLDSSGNAQTEVVSLNGTTEVESSNTYSAINGLRVASVGSGQRNEGDIYCGTGTFTSGVPATIYFAMDPLTNKGLSAYYVVPAGKTFYPMQFIMMCIASANRTVEVFIEQSTDGSFWFTEGIFEIESGVDFSTDVIALPGIGAGSHIRLEAKSSGSATEVTALLAGYLVDD